MEKSWRTGLKIAKAELGDQYALFDFDKMQEAHYVFNGMNRKTFPKEGVWTSSEIKWSRSGLGVFDFLLAKSAIPKPEEDDLVVLSKKIASVEVVLTCRVLESHIQSREEIGDLFFGNHASYSTVCGRSILALVDVSITT